MIKGNDFMYKTTKDLTNDGKKVICYYLNFLDIYDDGFLIVENNGCFYYNCWIYLSLLLSEKDLEKAEEVLKTIAKRWGIKYEHGSLVTTSNDKDEFLRLVQAMLQSNAYLEFREAGWIK